MRIPVELLLVISKHLGSVRNLVKLRQVCKEWRSFVDEFCLDELVLFVGVYPTLDLWKTNSQPIDFEKLICLPSNRCPLDHEGFRYVFRNIKRLFFSIRSEREVSYKLDFDKLNKLEITRYFSAYGHARWMDYHDDRYKLKSEVLFQLNLPSLATFHINELDENIVMDCPKVTLFSFDFIENYSSFDCPLHYKQIKQLNCYTGFRRDRGFKFECHKWIKKLENLEILNCFNFRDQFDPYFLQYFPKLKILFFHSCPPNKIEQIEEEKKNLNRTDLVIYYHGKNFEDFKNFHKVEIYRFPYRTNQWHVFTDFYKDDLAKLAPTLPQFESLNYDDALRISEEFDMQFYKRFLEKLTDVQVLNLNNLSHTQEEIVELISCLKNIVMLRVTQGGSLKQSFYDLLPDRYPYLRAIEVDNRKLENLKLDFLFKLSELNRVNFINTAFVQDKSDYRELMKKIERKKNEILRINGISFFNIEKEMMALPS